MKRFISLLIVIIMIMIITGCNKKKEVEDGIVVNNVRYVLNQDDEAYTLKIKVASNFNKVVYPNAISYYSEKVDGEYNFVIRIFQYKNFNIEKIVKDLTGEELETSKVTLFDKEYDYVKTDNNINIYIYKDKNYSYAITFTSKGDVEVLTQEFMKNVIYGE